MYLRNGAPDVLGLALKAVVALTTAAKDTALLLELLHGHGRELG